MEIFDGSTASVNYNYVFSSIPAARNKYAGLGRSTASAVPLVLTFIFSLIFKLELSDVSENRVNATLSRARVCVCVCLSVTK